MAEEEEQQQVEEQQEQQQSGKKKGKVRYLCSGGAWSLQPHSEILAWLRQAAKRWHFACQ